MTVGLIIEFPGVGQDKYDALLKEVHLDAPDAKWPDGLVSHCAGFGEGVGYVVDVWESREAADAFERDKLNPAIEKLMADSPADASPGAPEVEYLEPFQVLRTGLWTARWRLKASAKGGNFGRVSTSRTA